MTASLERAIEIAAARHAGQVDKAGQPYILHPLRVMLNCGAYDERVVAVLHDVVEDCPDWTMARLRDEGFSDWVLEALDSVTNREGESYDAFVQRAAAHPIGRAVKLADLVDNCEVSRIAAPTERDFERIAKYRRAIESIEAGKP